jgi:transposase
MVTYSSSMAMGKRKEKQAAMWVSTAELPKSPGHPFYSAVNQVLDSEGFDAFVEGLCAPFYESALGRPSLTPGRYFRSLLVGYFEGIDSERGIAWRAADSLAIRSFLGLAPSDAGPDHSTISRTRRRVDVETHRAVFTWVLETVASKGLLSGKTLGVDATTLEANAAMRSIVRRDTGESYQEFLTRLAKESGIKTPTREALGRLDRRRKNKGSNKEWGSPTDPDARITRMKDGRTHLAHKAEHAVDMETGAIVAVTLQGADQGDTTTIFETLSEASEQLAQVRSNDVEEQLHPAAPAEVIADKGYHSDAVLTELADLDLRTYISEPARGKRRWDGDMEARDAVYANRRRIRGARGRRLLRSRSEMLERPNAHAYETGGMRRTHLRGHTNILKRLLVHFGAVNLGLILRTVLGAGTPRSFQGRIRNLFDAFWGSLVTLWACTDIFSQHDAPGRLEDRHLSTPDHALHLA